MNPFPRRPVVVAVVAAVLVVSLVPATVAAQTGGGGTVVVEEGETVSEVNAVAGTVIIRGTVTGDVSALAGNVHVAEGGTVEGDLGAAAGNVRIGGTVDGDVSAGAGNVRVDEGATVGGNFDVAAGNVFVAGTIEGDATVGAETIRLGEAASIAGSLTYDGTLEGNVDAVQGEVTQDSTLVVDIASDVQPLAALVFAVYAFAINLLAGAVLLFLFPRFSSGVAERVATDPVRTGLIGLGVVVGSVVLLIALAITVVGVPFTIVGAFALVLVAWIGLVYGRFAVGAWLLSLVGVDNRWAALVVGLVVGAIIVQVPIVGGLINSVIALLGLGALVRGLYAHRRRTSAAPAAAPPEETPGD